MEYLGGGERLCCETVRSLIAEGHEVTLLSESFSPGKVENFFGYPHLFDRVDFELYPRIRNAGELGTPSHLLHHTRHQNRVIDRLKKTKAVFDLVFSTQDPGYIPDLKTPVLQWGYFPRDFPKLGSRSSPKKLVRFLRSVPLRIHYDGKISRIGLVLAISRYSQANLDRSWKRPSVIVYPACNMIDPAEKRTLVVTVARAAPIKRLEMFWRLARLRSQFEFVMLLTVDSNNATYARTLSEMTPANGKTIVNPTSESYHSLLGVAKAYVHFMEREHFGITVVEAMSALTIPIVHDSGGPSEILGSSLGFKWQRFEDIPVMLDEAMRMSPSKSLRERAYEFSPAAFDKRVSSTLS